MIQASSGIPVALRMQAGERIVTDQTVTREAQDNQPQVVLLPDSEKWMICLLRIKLFLQATKLCRLTCLRLMKWQKTFNGNLMFNS